MHTHGPYSLCRLGPNQSFFFSVSFLAIYCSQLSQQNMGMFTETLNYPGRVGVRLGYGGSGAFLSWAGSSWVTTAVFGVWCVVGFKYPAE